MKVGDLITAEVAYTPGSKLFTVTITDSARPSQPFSVSTKMTSADVSSAEWIAEAPWSGGTLALSDFGAVDFTNCSATIDGQQTPLGPFSKSNLYAITSVSKNNIPKAVPSAIAADNTDFSIS